MKTPASVVQPLLIQELRQLIESARQQVAQTANAAVTLLYWQLGKRIYQEVLQEQRAEYGEEILPTLSAKLVKEYGNSFGLHSLRRMIQFAETLEAQLHRAIRIAQEQKYQGNRAVTGSP